MQCFKLKKSNKKHYRDEHENKHQNEIRKNRSNYVLQETNANLKQIKLPVMIKEKNIECLIDTGSEHSLISKNFVKDLKLEYITTAAIKLSTVIKDSSEITTYTFFYIKFLSSIPNEYKTEALILKDTENIFIVGLDFLQVYNIVINLKNTH